MAEDNPDILLLNDEGELSPDDLVSPSEEVKLFADDIRKTRKASVVKGSASVKGKALKRKGSSKIPGGASKNKLQKSNFSQEDIVFLKEQMGISSMSKSVDSLSDMFRKFMEGQPDDNCASNTTVKHGKAKPALAKSGTAQTRSSNQAVVNTNSSILSLDPQLDYSEAIDNFDVDYLVDGSESNGVSLSPEHDFQSSFDPASGFNAVFEPRSSVVVNDDSHVDDVANDFEWPNIPQLQSRERTSAKISEPLAKAVNAALCIKPNTDSIKVVEDKYFRPENCSNLCTPLMNKEIWSNVPKFVHSQDSKMQDAQKAIIKGLIPIVELAQECVTSKEPLDQVRVREKLSDSLCLIGHGNLLLSQRRRSLIRPYLNEKFKPICNNDVPVDSNLFGQDCTKMLKELGDYTKIPIGNPKYFSRRKSFQRGGFKSNDNHSYGFPKESNRGGPVGRQGSRYNSTRGRGMGYRGFPRGQRPQF